MVFAGWLVLETVLVALVKLAGAPVDTTAEAVPPTEKPPEAADEEPPRPKAELAGAVELLADIPP